MTIRTAAPLSVSGHDQYLFQEGTHSRLYEKLGAHVSEGATSYASNTVKPSNSTTATRRNGPSRPARVP
jgi:1,4-alpha-glucan branching enzyme